MKNKKMSYILIPLVAIIWGLIFWKIYNHFTNKDDVSMKTYAIQPTKVLNSNSDTIHLLLNYRDPFLSYTYRPGSLISSDMSEKRNDFNQATVKTEINWPNIKYGGMIWNNKAKSKTGLLTYNSRNLLVKEGQLIEAYKISKLYGDSVTIEYNKVKKVFKR